MKMGRGHGRKISEIIHHQIRGEEVINIHE